MPQRSALRWLWAAGGLLVLALMLGGIVWSNRTTPPALGTYAGEAWSGNGLHIPFRWCPPGTFQMGSPATEAARGVNEDQVTVTLTQGFWLGQTEVTQRQWQSVMGTAPWRGERFVNEGANCPAVNVIHSGNPDSAVTFCERLTARERAVGRLPADWVYRLPNEAEWEYACRAGTTTAYSFGDDPVKLGHYAWFAGNSKVDLSRTESWLEDPALYAHPVGSKLANGWGLSDMHGSVWEWCADGYNGTLPGGMDPQVTDGLDRFFRGGCWDGPAWSCRSACRGSTPSLRGHYLGFRLALSPSGRTAERPDR